MRLCFDLAQERLRDIPAAVLGMVDGGFTAEEIEQILEVATRDLPPERARRLRRAVHIAYDDPC